MIAQVWLALDLIRFREFLRGDHVNESSPSTIAKYVYVSYY